MTELATRRSRWTGKGARVVLEASNVDVVPRRGDAGRSVPLRRIAPRIARAFLRRVAPHNLKQE
jgi:hypothetical protein